MIRKSIMNMSIEKVIEILDSGKAPETEQDFGDFDTAMETAINLLKTHPDNQLNDPLTLEELREMDGEPVWVDRPGYGKNWALVNVWAKSTNIIYLTCNNGMVLHPQPELDSGAKIYRRRPEGGVNVPEKVTSTAIKIALAEKHWKDFFLTEVKSGPTQLATPGGLKILDGLAVRKSWTNPCFTGYEVKISRSDFLRDAKFYTYEELCNCLYIVCPKGMIERTELPESVGLMYYDPEKKTITTKKKAIFRKIECSPEMLLYIIFSRLDSDRYPFFSEKRQYFKEYLAGKRDNRELAQAVKTKLVQDNARLENELEHVTQFRQSYEIYKAIQDVMHKHGIWIFRASDAAKELDKALSRKCPEDISNVRQSMEHIVERLKQMEEKANESTQRETAPAAGAPGVGPGESGDADHSGLAGQSDYSRK